jgi:C-terminal processing protease CtpA/Prc
MESSMPDGTDVRPASPLSPRSLHRQNERKSFCIDVFHTAEQHIHAIFFAETTNCPDPKARVSFNSPVVAVHMVVPVPEKENTGKNKDKKKRKSIGKKMKKIASRARQSLKKDKGSPTAPTAKPLTEDNSKSAASAIMGASSTSEPVIMSANVARGSPNGLPLDCGLQPKFQGDLTPWIDEHQQQYQQKPTEAEKIQPEATSTSKRSKRLFSWKKRGAPHKCKDNENTTHSTSIDGFKSIDAENHAQAEELTSYTTEPTESEVEQLLQAALQKAAMADSELITFQKKKSPAKGSEQDCESAGLGSGLSKALSAEDQLMKEVQAKIAQAEAELHIWEEQKAVRDQEKLKEQEIVEGTLKQVEENALVAQEEIRRWQTEKENLRQMEFRSQQRRVFQLIGIERHRAALWLNMPQLTQELKVTFWKGKLGLKIAPGNVGRQVVSALPDPSGQAARKGMQLGDVIIGINNNMLPFTVSQTDFGKLVRQTKRPFLLNILRKPIESESNQSSAMVTSTSSVLCKDVEEGAPEGKVPSDTWYAIPCPGNGDVGIRLGDFVQYVVNNVVEGSVAAQHGVQSGDVVVGLNGTPLSERIEPRLVGKMLCMIQRPYTLNLLREASRAPPSPIKLTKTMPDKGLFKTTKCEDKKRSSKRFGSPGSDSGSENGAPGESDCGHRRSRSGKKARRILVHFESKTKMPTPSPRKTVFQRMAQGRGAERSLAYPSNTSFLTQHPNDFKDATAGARTPPIDSKHIKTYRKNTRAGN